MAKGTKTGGRTKGTPNKATQEVQAKLDALKCDPIEGMAEIAMDENNSIELRASMFRELAQYVAPKRKMLDVVSEQTVHHYAVSDASETNTAEEWIQRYNPASQ